MPHVEVKCFPGKTEEEKKLLAEKITENVMEVFKLEASSVSVAIKEVEKEEWKKEVWDTSIEPEMNDLYVKPGYSYK